ncbi:extracellular solute-binding protein [Paenibacillus hamazuiensis]|uniref:extracellular solute-binding protein n=1 Tax=Paenibacillus hamazuiensis TaxID=2936508 RepID=UPI00200D9553|nr:extracellular solute-binding protein [Paenibacillus hamazuiensis]
MKGSAQFKLAIGMISAAMVFVTACGGSTGEGTASKDQPSAPAQAVNTDPLGKYDPPIEVTTVRSLDPNLKFREGENIDSNIWSKTIEKELGIKIKNSWTVNGAQYEQKMNVAIASGDLPEFMSLSPTQFVQLMDNGQLMDITSLVDKFGSPMLKEYLKSDGGLSLETATLKGKLMGIPTMASIVDSSPILWVRMDWLKKIGLPEPKTMDEVLKIAEAFANQDPDGNGKKDTVGFLASKELWTGYPRLMGFFNGYHAYPNIWIKDGGGKLVYGGIQPEMKTALGELQKLYKAGLMDQEFGVKDTKKVEETVASGKNGLFFGPNWAPLTTLQANKNNDPNADWKPFPVVSADGKPIFAQNSAPGGNSYFTAINKNAKHPEAVIKVLNLFVEKMWGAKADPAFTSEEATTLAFHKYPPVTLFAANKNLTQHHKVAEALKSKDTSKLNGEEKSTYDTILKYQGGDQKSWGTAKVFGEDSVYTIINNYKTNNQLIKDEMYLAPTPTMVQKKSTLDKMSDQMITSIILGAPLDDFDKFVSDWKKLGGDEDHKRDKRRLCGS